VAAVSGPPIAFPATRNIGIPSDGNEPIAFLPLHLERNGQRAPGG